MTEQQRERHTEHIDRLIADIERQYHWRDVALALGLCLPAILTLAFTDDVAAAVRWVLNA